MSSESSERQAADDEMLPEYDFGGVRGKHYQACRCGYQAIIHKTDGTTKVQDSALPEVAVILWRAAQKTARMIPQRFGHTL